MRPEVLDEVMQILSKQYGNPSSIHGYGRAAEKTINIARRHVATLIGSLPGEILFTSGGTESNNMAIHGVMRDWTYCNYIYRARCCIGTVQNA